MPTFSKDVDGSISEQTRAAIVTHLYELANEFAIEKFPQEHRTHLGVSVIGELCSRKLWYSFRWVKLEQFEGRMRRLFNRGSAEEEKFIELLLWMGFHVREIDPNTNSQYRFSKLGGHYGGSSDSIIMLPWFREDRVLAEYKTHNDKSFKKLKDKKLKIAKPMHWIQMSCYGKEFQTRYGLYCAVNKDTDEYYFELLELDWTLAVQMEAKAFDIISAKLPPQRISDQPSYFECQYCNFRNICHYNETIEINCRSCKLADPTDKGEWFCNRFKDIIPKEFVPKGCPGHVSINT